MQMATLKLALHLTPSRTEGPMNTGVYIFDYATAGPDYPNGVNNYWFIPQGAQYAKTSYDKKNYIKMTSSQ